jgi:phosphate transport system substrate-binding protein
MPPTSPSPRTADPNDRPASPPAPVGSSGAALSRRAWWRLGTHCAILLGLAPGSTRAAATLTVGGVGSVAPLIQRLALQFEQSRPGLRVRIVQPPMGTTGGLRALSARRIDLAAAGRPLGAGETGQVWPWLRTPIVFASSSGKLDRLDLPTLQAIYAGEMTRWPDGSPLRLVVRAPAESETIALRQALPELTPSLDAALARRDLPMPEDDLAALEFLARVAGSFGTTSLGLVSTLQAPVRVMGFEGTLPQGDTLPHSGYRLWRDYRLVHPPDPPADVRRFVDFLRAPSSLRTALALGYFPIDR